MLTSSQGTGNANKLTHFILGILAFIVGLALVFSNLSEVRRFDEMRSWPVVTGEITQSKKKAYSTSEGEEAYALSIAYIYEVDLQTYKGDNIGIAKNLASLSLSDANEILQKFPVGKNVNIHFNPIKKEESFLEIGMYKPMSNFISSGIFILVGVFIVIRGLTMKSPI